VPRSTGATTSCCRRRGLCAEAFRAAARADRSLRPHPRTRDAQACLGFLAFFQGDYEPARILLEESLAVQRRLGHGRAIAFSIYGLAMVAQAHGHYGVASTLCEESRAAFREVGDAWGEAMVFQGLGQTAYLLGDPAGARSFFEEGLRLCRKLGDRRNIAVLLSGLGTVAREQGDYGEAHLLLAESLAIYRRLGDAWGIATQLANLGLVAQHEGDHEAAQEFFLEALATRRETADRAGLAASLECFAGLALEESRPARAARLLGAAATFREGNSASSFFAERADREEQTATARTELGQHTFETAWEKGRSLTLEEALAYAEEGPLLKGGPVDASSRHRRTP
jgi:tetratricopeptide (TPR) repeat protein